MIMEDLVITLRMVERITAVLIGGLSIYLGYRLFFHLPFVHDNEGQIEMPGVKIVLSRIGPGVFFAAFGAMVLVYSFGHPISYERSSDNKKPASQVSNTSKESETPMDTKKFTGMSGIDTSGTSVNPQQRNKALTTIQMLNCAQQILLNNETDPDFNDKLSLAITDAKRTLMLSVWNEDDWGPANQLGKAGFADDAPAHLRLMFKTKYRECPQ